MTSTIFVHGATTDGRVTPTRVFRWTGKLGGVRQFLEALRQAA